MKLLFNYNFLFLLTILSLSELALTNEDAPNNSSDIGTTLINEESPDVGVSIEISPDAKEQILKEWLKQLRRTPYEGVRATRSSMIDISSYALTEAGDGWREGIEDYVYSHWDFSGKCPTAGPDQNEEAFESLIKDLPIVLAEAAGEKAVSRFDSISDVINIPLFIAAPFMDNVDGELTEAQTAIALGSATAVAATIGAAYLMENEIEFSEKIELPLGGDEAAIKSVTLDIGAENIGFSSNNPYLEAGTTIRLHDHLTADGPSFSISAGASHVTSPRATGKESINLRLTVPTVDSDKTLQTLRVRGSITATHLGPRNRGKYNGGSYNGSLVYSVRPRFNLENNPELSNLDININLTPISVSGGMLINPDTGRPLNQQVSTSAQATVGYNLRSTSSATRFSASVRGGLTYDLEGNASPTYGANFMLTIKPRSR